MEIPIATKTCDHREGIPDSHFISLVTADVYPTLQSIY